jgi:uncharacterized membrane protein YphA (DoxX/SURF4 family)
VSSSNEEQPAEEADLDGVLVDIAATVARVTVGLVLLLAGIAKARRVNEFAVVLRDFPLAEWVASSERSATALAFAVIAGEIAAGATLAVGVAVAPITAAVVALLAVFCVALALAAHRRLAGDCGCFARARAQRVRWTSAIARNVGLIALAVAGLASVPYSLEGTVGDQSRGPAFAALAALAALVVLLLSRRGSPLLVGASPAIATLGNGSQVLMASPAGSGSGRNQPSETELGADAPSHRAHHLDALSMEQSALRMLAGLEASVAQEEMEAAAMLERAEAVITEERELLALDDQLNRSLGIAYTAASDGSAETDADLVEVALLHWTVLLRRRTMSSLHTEVDGLSDLPDCRGDLVVDQLLLRYFQALADRRNEGEAGEGQAVENQVGAVRALAELARQSACLSERQSAWLASDLYWSYEELRGFLRLNGLERIVPYVAQAGAAPLLLFYDVEKYRGLTSPLGRWFAENREWLQQGALTRRMPLLADGLWLYDRRTGQLIGYRPVERTADENDVELRVFLDSIVSPANLGRRDCSFAEMIERGPSAHGYLCVGSVCSEEGEQIAAGLFGRTGRIWSRFSAAGSRGDVAGAQVQESLCGSTGAGGDSGDGGRGGDCNGGVSGLGRGWAADLVRCVSEQVVRPGTDAMRCIAEATGLCADPVETATKRLQETTFGGIRTGRRCQISEGGKTKEQQAYEDLLKADKEAQERAKAAVDAAVQEYKQKVDAIEKSHRKLYKDNNEMYGDDPEVLEEQNKIADQLRKEKLDKATEERDKKIREANEKEAKDKEKAREEYEKQTKEGQSGRCPPDTPDCGGADCSAMSTAAAATMACWKQAVDPQEIQNFRDQGGWTDPSPLDDPGNPSWTRCIAGFDSVDPVQRQCWLVDCGPTMATQVQGTACGCGPRAEGDPGDRLRGMCGTLDCPDGTPVVQSGRCTCAPADGGFGGPIPTGPFVLAETPRWSAVRADREGIGPPRGLGSGAPFDPSLGQDWPL